MGVLRDEQFGGGSDEWARRMGYSGAQGEPNPQAYPHPDDWIRAHKRWRQATAEGKPYRDPDMASMKRAAAAEEAPLHETYRQLKKTSPQRVRAIKAGGALTRGIFKGLGGGRRGGKRGIL